MRKKIIFFIFFVIEAFYLVSCIRLFTPEERLRFRRKPKKECEYNFIIEENQKINLLKQDIGNLILFENEIYYDIGETQYKNNDTYHYILNEVINFMKNNQKAILIIEGHADTLGYKSKKVNYMVSVNRALITKDYIIKYIDEERVKTYAYSDLKPRYDTNTDRNRRVDFIALKCMQEFEEYENFYSNYMTDFLIEIGIKNR